MGEQPKEEVRMSGYLEKKGGMKLIPAWKQYWFILKGQLLLYYKSELDCLNLSVHKGSINMGLASNVRPGLNRPNIIEIITRTQIITLRTKDRNTQEQWLQAMLESMAISKTARTSTVSMHMRYSLDNLPAVSKDVLAVNNSDNITPLPESKDNILARINRIGGRSYGTGSLESIIHRHDIICQMVSETSNGADEGEKRVSQDGSYVSEYAYIDNKLYHRKESGDVQNVSSDTVFMTNTSEDEQNYTYERLSVNNVKRLSKNETGSSDTVNKEWHSMTTVQGDRPQEGEPELPPRSPTTNKQHTSDFENDVEYAECYEEIGNNKHKEKNGKEDSKIRKKNSKKVKAKNKELKHESSNKDKNTSKPGKNSFLKSVFGHYRKKTEPEEVSNTSVQNEEVLKEEPTYESVDCPTVTPTELPETETSTVPPPKGGCKQSILPNNTLTELQQKLKTYDQQKDIEESAKSPTELKGESVQVEEFTDNLPESSPPSLPPRHGSEKRPSSPWHDIPSNNSPLDDDCSKVILSQEQQDSLLGTPQGFALLKSKWQAAERGGEWNPELQHLKLLPEAVEDLKEEDTLSVTSLCHLYSKVEKKSKANVDKRNLQDINLNSDGETMIVPISSLQECGLSVLKGSYSKTNELSKLKSDGMKYQKEDSFQQDSLMSYVLSDIESTILQANALPSNNGIHNRDDKCENRSNRDSNDLNILLAQLAEITTAPLLTPGATSSLVNYSHSDNNDQLALLEPIRHRRHSEPDYDIPRPHQSLLLRPVCDSKKSQCVDKEMNAGHPSEDALSCSLSISPDSLEPVTSQ